MGLLRRWRLCRTARTGSRPGRPRGDLVLPWPPLLQEWGIWQPRWGGCGLAILGMGWPRRDGTGSRLGKIVHGRSAQVLAGPRKRRAAAAAKAVAAAAAAAAVAVWAGAWGGASGAGLGATGPPGLLQ